MTGLWFCEGKWGEGGCLLGRIGEVKKSLTLSSSNNNNNTQQIQSGEKSRKKKKVGDR